MLAISVELLHGTFRGDPDGTANTGRQTRGEWPPSPARLYAALIAGDGTKASGQVADDSELEWFEQLPPPVIHAHSSPWRQPLETRYVVNHEGAFSVKGSSREVRVHMEYVGRAGAQHRAGVRLAPRYPRIVYVWPDALPTPTALAALRRRAARVGYLGAADSPARLRVAPRAPRLDAANDAFVPAGEGDEDTGIINVPAPGDLQIWDWLYGEWRQRGASAARSQFPNLVHGAAYRFPGSGESLDRGVIVASLRLERTLPGRRVSALAAAFKAALLSQYQRLHGEPPAILHGHGFTGKGYELARYLSLPDVGYRWSRGRIHGLALWLPPGSKAEVRQRARSAALSIRRLATGAVDVGVRAHAGEERPIAANPDRWQKTSRRWATVFPAIHERRGSLELAEVARWCRHAGLPAPLAYRSSRSPLIPGAVDLAPVEVNRPGRPPLPYSHVELLFAEAIAGPVVIGAGRQRGFGLCAPVHDASAHG